MAATRTILALALPEGPGTGDAGSRDGRLRLILRRGTCRGRIATERRGTGGFGYDPIFEPAGEPPGGRTFGQWSAEAKNRVSHRAKAARRMRPVLEAHGLGRARDGGARTSPPGGR